MGNAESVIVSRHERKHRSGRQRDGRTVPVDRDEPYRGGPQYTPSSGSNTSSQRRSMRRVRYPESQSSSSVDVNRPSGIPYSRDYSHGARGSNNDVVGHGYVVPSVYSNPRVGIPPIPRQDSVEPRASGLGASFTTAARQATIDVPDIYPNPRFSIPHTPRRDPVSPCASRRLCDPAGYQQKRQHARNGAASYFPTP